jgi:hypothetical protein
VNFVALSAFVVDVLSLQPNRPLPNAPRHLDEYILLALARAFEDAEAVVGGVQAVERRAFAEFLADWAQKVQMREFVARPAEEEHRHRDGARRASCRACRVGAGGRKRTPARRRQRVAIAMPPWRSCARRRNVLRPEAAGRERLGALPRPPSGQLQCRPPASRARGRAPCKESCIGRSLCPRRRAAQRWSGGSGAACSCWPRGRGRAGGWRRRAGSTARTPRPSPAWQGTSSLLRRESFRTG